MNMQQMKLKNKKMEKEHYDNLNEHEKEESNVKKENKKILKDQDYMEQVLQQLVLELVFPS